MKPKFNEDTLSEQPAIEQVKLLKYDHIHGWRHGGRVLKFDKSGGAALIFNDETLDMQQ